MFGKRSTEPNFKFHLLRLEMQALYKRRENLWFAVVNRATTTSETPLHGTLIIYFFSLTHCIGCRRRFEFSSWIINEYFKVFLKRQV
jgi:hypothetical protein